MFLDGGGQFFDEDVDGGGLEGGGEIGDLLLGELGGELGAGGGDGKTEFFLNGAEYGGFEAGKGEI